MPKLLETLKRKPVELNFGTSGLRGLVIDMSDLECYINTVGFINFEVTDSGYEKGGIIYLAGDLRDSTPRIMRAIHRAITDAGYETVYCGLIPTPAIAYTAYHEHVPCVMVTGSHIPADRNGIKYYKCAGEVMKEDELAVKESVAKVRQELYGQEAEQSIFNEEGMLKENLELPPETKKSYDAYVNRFTSAFSDNSLADKEIVFYQHSAVGRDMLVNLLEDLGAKVTPVGRSDVFVPIDSEDVRPEHQLYFKQLAEENPNAFAIVSTDGDSDRPFLIDESGIFHRGDILGAVVANWLKADFAAFPVSASDAATAYLDSSGIEWEYTKIGSPYVLSAMNNALASGKNRSVCWEVNGGFMTSCDFPLDRGRALVALPTRDAILPIIIALLASIKVGSVSKMFAQLPQRYTQAGLIDNFPTEVSKKIIGDFIDNNEQGYRRLEDFYTKDKGFGEVDGINFLDGMKIHFTNGDIAHMRPSGNAPQLRIYSVADSQARADEIVGMALKEPDGIFLQMQKELT